MRALPICRRLVIAALLMALCAAPAAAQVDADPLSFITAIYKSYKTNAPGLEDMYSRRLQALIDKDASETPEGMVGRIDWDVFVDGQDWRLSKLKIELVSRTETAARVRATFLNFDKPCDLLFDLVLEGGHWRIDEIQETLKPRWIMSKILADVPGAMPDSDGDDQPAGDTSGGRRIELR
jgi:hypothetical protein